MRLLVIAALLSAPASGQKQYSVLDWKTDVTVNTWLVQQMHDQYDQRRQKFAKAVGSPQAIQEYMTDVRRKCLRLLGNFPQKTSLHPIVTGTIQRDGYRIEKIIYESFPNHHVTANLYLPVTKGRLPAALLFCGHEDVSKATESYQRTAILFAKNGFVVLVIDPISQSERYQLTDAKGKSLARGGTTEHTLLNETSNLVGASTPADELWDNERGLDYLVTRAEVDTTRIGCLGNSGGGMQTIYFAAYDKRIKVIAPCSYLASRERTLEMSGPADGCAQMPGEGEEELEMSDYLIAAAPRPLLVLAGRYDFIDYTGTLAAYDDLKKAYASLGQSQKLRLFTYDDGHGISKPKREAAVTWFRKWLYKDDTPIKETTLKILDAKDLLCTKTGQVNTEYASEITIPQRNLERYGALEASRKEFLKQNRSNIIDKIRNLLSIKDKKDQLSVDSIGTTIKDGVFFEKLVLRKANETPVPLLVAMAAGNSKKVVLWFYEGGKNKIADSTNLMQSYLQNNYAVVLADIRGMGETEDRADQNDPKYYNREYRNAMLALHAGKPIIGGRVTDILSVMEYVSLRWNSLPVELNAGGFAAIPALYACVLSNKITQLNLYHTITSYNQILEHPLERDWYSYVVPDVLKYYDLPDLVDLAGKEKVIYK